MTDNYQLIYFYDELGAPLGLGYRLNGNPEGAYDYYFFEKNPLGDVIGLYKFDGTKVGTYVYDAWGNITVRSDVALNSQDGHILAFLNPFRYRGYFYDTQTGLYYLQSRYYNPQWGRFINADSSLYHNMLGYNMFAYCNNNPINFYDPCGKMAQEFVAGYASTMGWITWIDGPLPLGDIVYYGGLVIGGLWLIGEIIYSEDSDVPAVPAPKPPEPVPENPTSDSGDVSTDNDIGLNDSDSANSSQPGNLPTTGEPDSDQNLYDETGLKQTRHYGSDGKADYDIDYHHPGKHHKFPHKHKWTWVDNIPKRGGAIDIF